MFTFKSIFIQSVAFAVGCGAVISNRAAAEVSLDLNIGKQRPVVVQPASQVERRWVPEQVIRKEERVLVSAGRTEHREEKFLVEPARRVKREEKVLVEPERVEKRVEKVLVRPATVEKQWVPGVVDEVRIGPIDIKSREKNGYFREVVTPAVYENVVREVRIPARYDVVVREFDVPAKYDVRFIDVPCPPRYETVYKDVVIPGHFEEVVVTPPPVVVPGRRTGFDLDIDIGKRR